MVRRINSIKLDCERHTANQNKRYTNPENGGITNEILVKLNSVDQMISPSDLIVKIRSCLSLMYGEYFIKLKIEILLTLFCCIIVQWHKLFKSNYDFIQETGINFLFKYD